MIRIQQLEEVIFQTIVRGATVISPDVKAAFDRAIEKSQKAIKQHSIGIGVVVCLFVVLYHLPIVVPQLVFWNIEKVLF